MISSADAASALRRPALLAWSLVAALAAVTLPGACTRDEAPWPSRSIKVEAGYAAGQGADGLTHVFADQLERALGSDVFASESLSVRVPTIATGSVARAQGDGYSLVIGSTDAIVMAPLFDSRLASAERNLCPVALVFETPHVLIVSAATQVATLEELVDTARRRPGFLAYASLGSRSTTHALGELFTETLDLDMWHVPYRTGAAALKDLLGGEVPAMFATLQAVLPAIRTGRVRALAVSSAHRAPELPDIPTFAERGLSALTSSYWFGIFTRCGANRDVEGVLAFASRDALARAEVSGLLGMRSSAPEPLLGEAFGSYVQRERARWMQIVERAGPAEAIRP